MKKLIAIAVIVTLALLMIYIMNDTKLFRFLFGFGSLTAWATVAAVYGFQCLRYAAKKADDENHARLTEWRKNLKYPDVVYYKGRQFKVENNYGDKCQITNYNDHIIVRLTDLMPTYWDGE